MLAGILEHYIADDLGKQILKKLPYCVAVALVVYLVLAGSFSGLTTLLLWISGLSALLFLGSAAIFLRGVNEPMKNLFGEIDLKKLVAKLRSIYEKGDSLLTDVQGNGGGYLLITGLTNGVSFFVLLTCLTLSLMLYSHVALEIAAAGLILVSVYLTYDAAKAPVTEEPKDGGGLPLGSDLLEKYTITNSLQRSPMRSRMLLYVAARLFGPVVDINLPRFSCEATLVYETQELIETIQGLVKLDEDKGAGKAEDTGAKKLQKMSLKPEGGQSTDLFFMYGRGDAFRLTAVVEESPKTVFPYLLDPDSRDDGKGWIALAILEAGANRTVGHVFIQKFAGVYVKTKLKQERHTAEPMRKRAFQFFLLGERPYVQYLKNAIEINAPRVPSYVMDKEYEP